MRLAIGTCALAFYRTCNWLEEIIIPSHSLKKKNWYIYSFSGRLQLPIKVTSAKKLWESHYCKFNTLSFFFFPGIRWWPLFLQSWTSNLPYVHTCSAWRGIQPTFQSYPWYSVHDTCHWKQLWYQQCSNPILQSHSHSSFLCPKLWSNTFSTFCRWSNDSWSKWWFSSGIPCGPVTEYQPE